MKTNPERFKPPEQLEPPEQSPRNNSLIAGYSDHLQQQAPSGAAGYIRLAVHEEEIKKLQRKLEQEKMLSQLLTKEVINLKKQMKGNQAN